MNRRIFLFSLSALFFIGAAVLIMRFNKPVPSRSGVVASNNSRQPLQQSLVAVPSAPSPVTKRNIPPVTVRDHIRGNTNAPLTIVEYSDLECPNCRKLHPIMNRLIKEDGNKFRWVYRHFPLTYHANAIPEAEASECAGEIGGDKKFWEYIDKIFERTTSNGTGFALDKLAPLAQEIGIDKKTFESCLSSGKYKSAIAQQYPLGLSYGIRGTPTLFVSNNKGISFVIPGVQSYETLKAVIATFSK